MKILIFTQYFWPENFQINHLALSLIASGHEVEVLTGKPNYPSGNLFPGYKKINCSNENWRGIKINRVPIIPRGSASAFRLAVNYISFVISGIFFSPWMLRKKQYDLIFVFAPSPIFQVIPASFLGWIKKIPVVLWIQDLWPESASATGHIKSNLLLRLLRLVVRFCYANCSLLLISSRSFLGSVKEMALSKPIEYFPNSIEERFYSIDDTSADQLELLNTGFVVMFAGNLGNAQSVETIISAAQKLTEYPEIKIVLLGTGVKYPWIAEQIKKNNLKNLVLGGQYDSDAMPHLLRQASVLLASLADQPILNLTVPSKLQAYLAVGRPIIACLNGEAATIVKEAKAGLHVPAEDSDALANAIIELYEMPVKSLERMGINGRLYFKKHFDSQMLTDQLISYFEDLLLTIKR
jgi:glycosyltransferase involved in cell wall biosynthesis